MRLALRKIRDGLSTRIGFFTLTLFLFWMKTYIVYNTKFTLGVSDGMQEFLLALNPIPAGLLLFGIALYFRGRKSYWIMIVINLLQSLWLLPIFYTIENFQIFYR